MILIIPFFVSLNKPRTSVCGRRLILSLDALPRLKPMGFGVVNERSLRSRSYGALTPEAASGL
jgi:hypothetical protein